MTLTCHSIRESISSNDITNKYISDVEIYFRRLQLIFHLTAGEKSEMAKLTIIIGEGHKAMCEFVDIHSEEFKIFSKHCIEMSKSSSKTPAVQK